LPGRAERKLAERLIFISRKLKGKYRGPMMLVIDKNMVQKHAPHPKLKTSLITVTTQQKHI